MPEPECFRFTHEPGHEISKSLIYRHYRRERTNLYGPGFDDNDKYLQEEELERLAYTPVMTPQAFGLKMTIALSYRNPSGFFRICRWNGQLEKYFPELYNCIGCTQDPNYHTDDVFEHTMLALDAAEIVGANCLDTKLAVLFHDLGEEAGKEGYHCGVRY